MPSYYAAHPPRGGASHTTTFSYTCLAISAALKHTVPPPLHTISSDVTQLVQRSRSQQR